MRRDPAHVLEARPPRDHLVVLRHLPTGRYLAGHGRWVADPAEALPVPHLGDVRRVAELASCEAGPVEVVRLAPPVAC